MNELTERKWAELRYHYDSEARNRELLNRFLSRIPDRDELDIIDLGAGYGHNFIFLHQKIEQNQDWVLIEYDRTVVLKGIRMIASHLIRNGWSVVIRNLALVASKEDKHIRLHYELDDLSEHLGRFKDVDVVTSNALFDLLRPEELSEVVNSLNGSLFYSTMNLQDILISGDEEGWMNYYREYLRRDGRIGMGVCEWFSNQTGFSVAQSNWTLGPDDEKCLFHLFERISMSLSDFIPEREITQYFIWERRVKRKIVRGDLEVLVRHCDVLYND